MKRLLAFGLAGLIGLGAIVAIWAWQSSDSAAPSPSSGPPPFRGEMQAFQPADAPKPAPDIAFVALDGSERRLSDFRGRVVLVNFWATWCGPCVREMPALDRLVKALGAGDFELLAISIDRGGRKVVDPFLDKIGLKALPVYLDTKSETTRAFGVRGLPTTVLIDRDGREAGRLEGGADWDNAAGQALIRHYLARKGA